MKAEDLKTKTQDELKKLLLDERKAQFNLRFQRSNGQMEKTAEIRKIRRNIARIKTFMSAGQNNQAAAKPKSKAKAGASGKAA